MEAERLYTKQPSRTIQQKRGGKGALEMVDNRYFPLQFIPIQLGRRSIASHNVQKLRNGQWYSPYNPYKLYTSKRQAIKAHQNYKLNKYDLLRARVPTIYTYTHTKTHAKLSHTLQGPHTIAHRLVYYSIINATLSGLQKIFDTQILSPADVSDIVFKDEKSGSGYTKELKDRLIRYNYDYCRIFNITKDELKKCNKMHKGQKKIDRELVSLKHHINQLLNMDPYAVYGWKTTKPASKSSLKGKGEGVSHPTFEDLHDKPRKGIFVEDYYASFIKARKELYNLYEPYI